jgi:hypothetical protein
VTMAGTKEVNDLEAWLRTFYVVFPRCQRWTSRPTDWGFSCLFGLQNSFHPEMCRCTVQSQPASTVYEVKQDAPEIQALVVNWLEQTSRQSHTPYRFTEYWPSFLFVDLLSLFSPGLSRATICRATQSDTSSLFWPIGRKVHYNCVITGAVLTFFSLYLLRLYPYLTLMLSSKPRCHF